jgi:succinyl-CoA synthetase beta subunit
VANFTNVAATFKGLIKAIRKAKEDLKKHKVKIFVRRGGPNASEVLHFIDIGFIKYGRFSK